MTIGATMGNDDLLQTGMTKLLSHMYDGGTVRPLTAVTHVWRRHCPTIDCCHTCMMVAPSVITLHGMFYPFGGTPDIYLFSVEMFVPTMNGRVYSEVQRDQLFLHTSRTSSHMPHVCVCPPGEQSYRIAVLPPIPATLRGVSVSLNISGNFGSA